MPLEDFHDIVDGRQKNARRVAAARSQRTALFTAQGGQLICRGGRSARAIQPVDRRGVSLIASAPTLVTVRKGVSQGGEKPYS